MNYNNLTTPGVTIREEATLPPSVVQVSTAIPAFIGYTEKGPQNQPTAIASMKAFEDTFGGPYSNICEIDSNRVVTTPKDNPSIGTFILHESLQLYFANGGGPCYIVSVGSYSNSGVNEADFRDVSGTQVKGLDTLLQVDEPTLIVLPDAINLPEKKDTASYTNVFKLDLTLCGKMQDRMVLIDTPKGLDSPPKSTTWTSYRGSLSNANLSYGAAYYPLLETSLAFQFDEASIVNIQSANKTLAQLKSAGDALYNEAIHLLREHQKVILPPSGALNVDPTSGKSINAIRTFSGRGVVVWGARTLAGNDNNWRYIPVRRLFMTVEESVKKMLNTFVFDKNDTRTWVKVSASINAYLTSLWQQGALLGVTPEEAFFVNVGLGKTMTTQDVLEGRLNIEIGLAATRPAEFIIVKFSHHLTA